MRTVIAFAVVAVVWLGAASSARAQGNLVPKPGGAFTPPQGSKPLFPSILKNQEEARLRLEARAALRAPTAMCGMTVIPATPEVDPKSIKKAPTDKKYTMRFVPPSMCGQDSINVPTVVMPPPTVAPR
jgi:hypothetical protein